MDGWPELCVFLGPPVLFFCVMLSLQNCLGLRSSL